MHNSQDYAEDLSPKRLRYDILGLTDANEFHCSGPAIRNLQGTMGTMYGFKGVEPRASRRGFRVLAHTGRNCWVYDLKGKPLEQMIPEPYGSFHAYGDLNMDLQIVYSLS